MRAARHSPPVLAILAALVEEHTGIRYAPGDHEVLAEKAALRAADAGFESLLDYYYFLRYDPAGAKEREALVDALVVRETYFFREWAQIEVLAGLVAARVERGARPRVWSAACATGEEPLTVAMVLADRGLLDAVDLVASDLSDVSLARARAGAFGSRSLRDVPAAATRLAERYLRREPGGGYRVDDALRGAVAWRKVNLADRDAVAAVGPCDFILCRNVLIYFGDDTARRVVESLGAALRPDGALFVGISESLLRFGTSLECEELGNAFLYRRRA
jgi:chemotaxis protein methyltransferase CheR